MTDYKRIRVSPQFSKLKGGTPPPCTPIAGNGWKPMSGAVRCPTVVVTHHAPSARSLQPDFQSDLLSAAYASHLDEFVSTCGAALWVHGHTHWSVDYRIGNTRVLANQRGYPDAAPNGFDPALVVTV